MDWLFSLQKTTEDDTATQVHRIYILKKLLYQFLFTEFILYMND